MGDYLTLKTTNMKKIQNHTNTSSSVLLSAFVKENKKNYTKAKSRTCCMVFT